MFDAPLVHFALGFAFAFVFRWLCLYGTRSKHAALKDRVKKLEGTVEAHESRLDKQRGRIGDLGDVKGDVEDLEARMETAEKDIGKFQRGMRRAVTAFEIAADEDDDDLMEEDEDEETDDPECEED